MTVVGIAWNGDETSFQSFVDRHHLTFANAEDLDNSLYAHFGVPGQPAWVFVNSKGVAKRAIGVVPEATLDKVLSELT